MSQSSTIIPEMNAYHTLLNDFKNIFDPNLSSAEEEKLIDRLQAMRHFRALNANAEYESFKKHLKLFEEFNTLYKKIKPSDPGNLSAEERMNICRLWFLVRNFNSNDRTKEIDPYIFKCVALCSAEEHIELAQIYAERFGYSRPHQKEDPLKIFNLSIIQQTELKQALVLKVHDSLPAVSDAALNELVQSNNREVLQYLIYKRFSGRFNVDGIFQWFANEQKYPDVMEFNKEYRNENIPLTKLVELFKKAMRAQEEFLASEGYYYRFCPFTKKICTNISYERKFSHCAEEDQQENNKTLLQDFTRNKSRYRSPVEGKQLKKTESRFDLIASLRTDNPGALELMQQEIKEGKVHISQGGGYFHLLEFLTGRTEGYIVKGNDFGIYVTPAFLDNRDLYYARRTSVRYFDQPAVFTAAIKPKFLLKVPNAYEAGLYPDFVELLESPTIQRVGMPEQKPNESQEKNLGPK